MHINMCEIAGLIYMYRMYVYIEVALCGVPMESGIQLGLGEGPIISGSNVPTP